MTTEVSSTEPDWTREEPRNFWDPGRRLLRSIRKYQSCVAKEGIFSKICKKYWAVQHRFWSVVCGAEIDLRCEIGGGLLITHPNGIVIHPNVRIGVNCLIFQQVTLGMRHDGVPTIGGHVDIGAGAKILGEIDIGDNALIGANAVVVKSVASGSTVVGIPARPV